MSQVPHRAIFEIQPAMLIGLFKAGCRSYEVVSGAIPDDAVVYGAAYDALRDVWRIGIEHESLPECPDAALPITILPDVVVRQLDHRCETCGQVAF